MIYFHNYINIFFIPKTEFTIKKKHLDIKLTLISLIYKTNNNHNNCLKYYYLTHEYFHYTQPAGMNRIPVNPLPVIILSFRFELSSK